MELRNLEISIKWKNEDELIVTVIFPHEWIFEKIGNQLSLKKWRLKWIVTCKKCTLVSMMSQQKNNNNNNIKWLVIIVIIHAFKQHISYSFWTKSPACYDDDVLSVPTVRFAETTNVSDEYSASEQLPVWCTESHSFVIWLVIAARRELFTVQN